MSRIASPTAFSPARSRRGIAVASITGLLVAGLVAVAGPASPALAVDPPDGSETFLVSRTDAGTSTQVRVTPDGQHVVFASTAADLVAGDTNGLRDVFRSVASSVSDPFATTATLISTPDAAMPEVAANGPSSLPSASADGRYVAFLSSATNLVPGVHAPDAWTNVYVRDTILGTTVRLQGPGGEPLGDAHSVDMSDDGRYIAFVSDAANLTSDDTNAASDGFIADLDADGNGTRGDISITRVVPDRSIPLGVSELVISGNGVRIALLARSPLGGDDPAGFSEYLYRGSVAQAGADFALVSTDASEIDTSGSGEVIVYISQTACTEPSVIAATYDSPYNYYVGVGRYLVDRRVGTVSDPTVSADGGIVAWSTTQPQFDFTVQPALPEPVVRTADPVWRQASTGLMCDPDAGWQDIATGEAPSLSAGGRTVALSGPTALSGAAASAIAVDTHSHDGLAVASTLGELIDTGQISIVDIAKIPVSDLKNYAAALADAPVYRLPVYRLPVYRLPVYRLPVYRLLIEDSPVYRLPVYRLPVYRLPVYRLDIPGGWPELLAETPYGDELLQSVTLAEVLEWAQQALADGSGATAAQRAAATRIQSLTLDDVDLDGTGIDSFSLASMVLGGARLADIAIAGTGTPQERWQEAVEAQALAYTVGGETILAELDSAGLDIGRSGVESAVLRDLPIGDTLFDSMTMESLFLEGTPVGALEIEDLDASTRTALFPAGTTGTLAANKAALLPGATVADLAAGAPADVTFGDLLFSLLDTASYPWEQIEPASINPNAAVLDTSGYGCDGQKRCGTNAQFSFTFDPGPGESTTFTAPTASITLPVGTAATGQYLSSASGPTINSDRAFYSGPVQVSGNLVRMPLADAAGGTSIEFEVWYTATSQPGASSATATLASGDLTGSLTIRAYFDEAYLDDVTNNRIGDEWEDPARQRAGLKEGLLYYEWISAGPGTSTDEGYIPGPALDEDYYLVDPPDAGERLVISTNASDGQISLALFSASAPSTPLGVEGANAAPGTAVTEQTGSAGAPAESGGDAAAPLAGHTLVDQAVLSGGGSVEIEAASTDSASGEQMLLRVTSGNGQSSSSLYSLRARYIQEPAETMCADWEAPQEADPGQVGVNPDDPIPAGTNTVYLFDQKRFGDIHGAAAATQVRDALELLDDVGGVAGAVLSIDADPGVESARATLDANPCSMAARRALSGAVNTFVSAALGDQRDEITSIVVVGGDDVLPFAPVAQHTAQFNEASHAASLRLPEALDGSACPASVSVGVDDPCATPLSAAAGTNHILSDDPYALADAYESLGGYLYVPTVAIGRLVETPTQIIEAIDRFTAADGVLTADSTLAGGYGAWAELPDLVTENLTWRRSAPASEPAALPAFWSKSDVEERLFPASGDSPRVVSLNTHADETRLLPGVEGAEDGRFAETALLEAEDYTNRTALAESLVFMIGCHAGGNLPTSYYGDVTDWADVFGSSAGFVGNTGFGLANNITTALSERLLDLYSDWIGVETGAGDVTSAGALTYAKQSYLGGLGLYSGYDEKVLMQAVYYGLPMYTFADAASGETKEAPLPEIPDDLSAVQTTEDGLSAASLSLDPALVTKTGTDAAGNTVSYLAVTGEEPLSIPGQPILPRVTYQVDPAPTGQVARGALITGLTSTRSGILTPAIAQASVGVTETAASRNSVAFPSTFATMTTQQTPTGPIDLLVVTPGRVEAPAGGQGVLESFDHLDIDVVYGDSSSTDVTAPLIRSVEELDGRFTVRVDGTGSDISAVLLLVQPVDGDSDGDGTADGKWTPYRMTAQSTTWRATTGISGPVRWIVQAVDAAGNVGIDTARGHLDPAGAAAPIMAEAGEDAALNAGERLVRSVPVEQVTAGERLQATLRVENSRGEVVAGGPVVVETGSTGTAHALIDQVLTMPGEFTARLTVCRGTSCTTNEFPVVVESVLNSAPAATVTLSSSTPTVVPSSVLTATASGSDPDGDDVAVTLRWYVNGGGLPVSADTLDLSMWTVPGDVVTVTATPNDGLIDGHVASAQVVVKEEALPPAPPTIIASAYNAEGNYQSGTWSGSAVTVTFDCSPGNAPIVVCPEPVSLTDETTSTGVVVEGVVRDADGRTATASLLVNIDLTAPTLAPTVTPSTVPLGQSVEVFANATDLLSGVFSEACDVPSTATAGTKTATCRATDAAGNTAEATVQFTVQAPPPALPTITVSATAGGSPYTAGTWSRVPVVLAYTCTSGVAVSSCAPSRTITADTGPAGQTVTGTVTDELGRTAQTSILVKVDRTAPQLTPTATPASVTVGGTVVLAANPTDTGSGVASQSCDAPNTATVGTKTATCRATDVAGNTATKTVTYTVTAPAPPQCHGVADRTPLLALNPDGSSVFLRTSGVPIVFRACDAAGKSIGTKNFVKSVTLVSTVNLPASAKINEIWYLPLGGFTYVSAAKTWIGQIPTVKLASGKKYTYKVSLADGTSFTVTFGVR